MLVVKVIETHIITENSSNPLEGFFWVIDGKVVGVAVEVPKYNYSYELYGITHKNTWCKISSEYLVDGKEVSFDYFPRGRVMVDPNYDCDKNFIGYSAIVFLDDCLDNKETEDKIREYYNLNVSMCDVMFMRSLRRRAGIDHYTCHNCR